MQLTPVQQSSHLVTQHRDHHQQQMVLFVGTLVIMLLKFTMALHGVRLVVFMQLAILWQLAAAQVVALELLTKRQVAAVLAGFQ
jgi:hypothetical protein